jgi:hypothetical protein
MKDDNQSDVQKYQLSDAQIKLFVDKSQDKHVKMIWNVAIETAAMKAKENGATPNVLLKIMKLVKK